MLGVGGVCADNQKREGEPPKETGSKFGELGMVPGIDNSILVL